jgi:hypothetical protein
MPTEYTPTPALRSTITLPEDGEVVDAASLSGMEQLADIALELANRTDSLGTRADTDDDRLDGLDDSTADLTSRTAALETRADTDDGLLARAAYKDEGNVFTQPQTVALASGVINNLLNLSTARADIALVSSIELPTDHPGSGSNQWKLISSHKRAGGQYALLYVGTDEARGAFAVVVNAVWCVEADTVASISVPAQRWARRNTGQPATALLLRHGSVLVAKMPAGIDTWADWPAGDLAAASIAAADVAATHDVTVGHDAVVTHDAFVHHDLTVDHYIFALDMIAEVFRYTEAFERITNVPIQYAHPKLAVIGDTAPAWKQNTPGAHGWIALSAGAVIELPIQLPAEATLHRIDIYHVQQLIAQDTMKLVSWSVADWTDPSLGFDVPVEFAGDSSFAGNGPRITSINLSEVIDVTRNYQIEFTAGRPDSRFMAVRLVWDDPGPRNY